MTLHGRVSWFGGPNDLGVSPSEGLALIEPIHLREPDIARLFLANQPAGTTGLARRLNPDVYFIACRWDYSLTPKAYLRSIYVKVTANGITILAKPADWGPNLDTDRAMDLSKGALSYLGLKTDDIATVTIQLPS